MKIMKIFKMFILDAENNTISNEIVKNGNITIEACNRKSAINKVEKLLNVTGTVMLYSENNKFIGSFTIEKKN